MKHLFSRRFFAMLRVPVQALLMLAVLMNPVLAAVGDMHESGHGAAMNMHETDNHGHGDNAGMQDEEGDLLHAFMHAAHCCSHLAAVFEGISLADVHDLMPAAQLPELLAPHPAPRTSVFRPPIAI